MKRRNFIKAAGCTGMGYLTLFNSAVNLKAMGLAALDNSDLQDDYKALVCILLAGGNDSYNMLIPLDPEAYRDYAQIRSNMALDQSLLLPLNPTNTGGKTYGLHPSMVEIEDLYHSGECTFVNNVGTLVAPTTKAEYMAGSARLPLGLFSHGDQENQWQSGLTTERSITGWGGRIADLLKDQAGNDKISMTLSLGGNNLFQQGVDAFPFTLNQHSGADLLWAYQRDNPWNIESQAIKSLIYHRYEDAFKQTYVDVITNAQESGEIIRDAYANRQPYNTTFDDNHLSRSLKMIADIIAARNELGVKRQIFFASMGGFDYHDELFNNQARDLSTVSRAIGAFQSVMRELNLTNQVTSFTISDFARTLTSNGNGTDHAWGASSLVVGGAVNGNKFYGAYPSLKKDGNFDVGNGIILPTTSTDEYFAELALWFGVSPGELSTVFPSLHNFYDYQSGNPPLGFMNI
jgi:uncharacterized protein (DUF1501 family)